MFAVGHFEDVAGAIAATADALELQPSAVEMIDRTILSLSRAKLEFRRLSDRLEGDPGALLFVSFSGDTQDEVRDKLDQLTCAWERNGHGYHTLRAETAAEQDALTKVRKAGLGLLMAASEGRRRPAAFVEDTAVAPEVLGEYVEQFKTILDRHGLEAGWYGHCSVGCLHIRPFVDLSVPAEVETMRTVAEEIVELVGEFDGVNSSEHGDGRVRSPFNERIFGPELYGAMRKVKALFDPKGILNPGVMVDAEPLTVHVRDASLPAAAAAEDPSRLRRGRDARRRRPLPADRRVPEDRHRRHVPVVHGHARGGARHPRAGERAGQGAVVSPIRTPRSATSACTRSSTSASSARRARASARCRSTWRR